jgi:hypothetical protein
MTIFSDNQRQICSLFLSALLLAIGPVSAATNSPLVATQLDDKSTFDDFVKALGVKSILTNEDAKSYSADLSGLVGNYFYVDSENTIALIGRPDTIPRSSIIQLKDKIVYQSAVEQGGELSATLPWLSFLFKANVKTSILMQDIATVIGTSDPRTIKENLPTGIAPKGKTIWFISGATVTVVSASSYSNKSFTGSSIIQVGGSKLYTKNGLQNAWIISINKVPASAGENLSDPLAGKIVKIKPIPKNKSSP